VVAAPRDGTVVDVRAASGEVVKAGETLVIIE
jgi:biotin carboxyl carrier protein